MPKSSKSSRCEWTCGFYDNDYRVDMLPKSYLTITEIISLKSIRQLILTCLNERKELFVTDRRTNTNYRKATKNITLNKYKQFERYIKRNKQPLINKRKIIRTCRVSLAYHFQTLHNDY